jgi:phosphocarrier protein FPr
MKNQISLLSPISGLTIPLSEVPDAVFAGGMLGSGMAIDPTEGKVLAPCEGKVVNLHPSLHALTLELADGAQVLIHVGIDTVKLRGEGFKAHVKKGESVKAGQLLIEFDLDSVAMVATSLISPVILVEPKGAQLKFTSIAEVKAGQDELYSAGSAGVKASVGALDTSDAIVSKPIRISDPTGLHARPAAVIANLASQFECIVQVHFNGYNANAKSLIAIMSLEIPGNSRVQFLASGKDAKAAIAELEKNMGSAEAQDSVVVTNGVFKGVVGSKGRASGKVYFLKRNVTVDEKAASPKVEKAKLEEALILSKNELHHVEESMRASVGAAESAIFAAHRGLLQDPELLAEAFGGIEKGLSCGKAWQNAVAEFSAKLLGLKSELLAARASDLQDVGQRVAAKLSGNAAVNFQELTQDTILVAEDIGPGDLANLRGTRVVGICTTGGGATSHAAIIARALGLPALHGVSSELLQIASDETVILDADHGVVKLSPTARELEEVKASIIQANLLRKQELQECSRPALTRDGHKIDIAANLATEQEAVQALEFSAEGVGLLRSELYFSSKLVEPSEEEQFEFYRSVASQFKNHPTIIRTLDVGGDKPLPYLPMKAEENPFLGERGIRFTFNHEKVFRRQIRAIVRAAEFGNVHIMFPMVSTLDELRAAKAILEEETKSLKVKKIPVGIMVEVPTAALIADSLAKEVDFFSIGTNDLTQYTIAMDRTNPNLSKLVDGLHPGVLRLIQMTVEAAHRNGKWVGVCGGMAAEPEAIPVLLGLGVDELSVSVPAIPSVRAALRKLNYADCKSVAARALTLASASEVRALL